MRSSDLTAEVIQAGLDAGCSTVGVVESQIMTLSRDALLKRKAAGLNSSMQFTYRNPERSSDPSKIMEDAASIVAATFRYSTAMHTSYDDLKTKAGTGVVSRFARHDYYSELRSALAAIVNKLESHGYKAIAVADSNALVDREVAWRAGLGWFGKNSNILTPEAGSWVLLGSVVTNAVLDSNDEILPDGCASCTKCIDLCPTDAIIAPGVLDANRCIAWLVQSPDPIPTQYRVAVGTRLYGCDECQEVCPPNQITVRKSGDVEHGRDQVDLFWLLEATDSELLENIDSWYIPKRDPNFVRRTALINLGNSAVESDGRTWPLLRKYLGSTNEMLVTHAIWASKRLGFDKNLGAEINTSSDAINEELVAEVELRLNGK